MPTVNHFLPTKIRMPTVFDNRSLHIYPGIHSSTHTLLTKICSKTNQMKKRHAFDYYPVIPLFWGNMNNGHVVRYVYYRYFQHDSLFIWRSKGGRRWRRWWCAQTYYDRDIECVSRTTDNWRLVCVWHLGGGRFECLVLLFAGPKTHLSTWHVLDWISFLSHPGDRCDTPGYQ